METWGFAVFIVITLIGTGILAVSAVILSLIIRYITGIKYIPFIGSYLIIVTAVFVFHVGGDYILREFIFYNVVALTASLIGTRISYSIWNLIKKKED